MKTIKFILSAQLYQKHLVKKMHPLRKDVKIKNE